MSWFPRKWDTVALGDVFDVQLGKMLSKKAKTGTSSYRYLGNKNVQWNRVDVDELQEMDFTPAERKKFALCPGDLLVCEGGEVGRTAVWRGELEDCYYQKALHRLRPRKGRVHPEFMLRFMRLAAERDMFAGLTSQTSIAHLTKEKLETLEIPLPPLPEQKRIAAILDKADAIRRKRQEAIRLTEELLRSAFLEMFGDPVTNPKGWEVKKLGEVVTHLDNGWSPVCETRPAQGDEWAVLKLGCVTYGRYDASESKAMIAGTTPRKDLEVKAGDLLFSRKNTFELVGATAFVFDTPPRRTLPDTVFRLGVVVGTEPIYLWQLLSHPGMRARLRQEASGTAGSMPNISKGRLREVEVPVPPAGEQRRFGAFVRRAEQHRRQVLNGDVDQMELTACLTQRAFAGKL